MPQRFKVRASLVKGQTFYCRAGRGWSSEWTEITVLDQDDDPMHENKVKNLPDVPDPERMGRKSFALVSKDSRLTVQALDGGTADAIRVPALESRAAELEASLTKSRAEVESLTMRAKVAEGLRDTKQARVAELEDLLSASEKERDKAHSSALEVIEQVKRDCDKRVADLQSLLDEATKPAAPVSKKNQARG